MFTGRRRSKNIRKRNSIIRYKANINCGKKRKKKG